MNGVRTGDSRVSVSWDKRGTQKTNGHRWGPPARVACHRGASETQGAVEPAPGACPAHPRHFALAAWPGWGRAFPTARPSPAPPGPQPNPGLLKTLDRTASLHCGSLGDSTRCLLPINCNWSCCRSLHCTHFSISCGLGSFSRAVVQYSCSAGVAVALRFLVCTAG